MTLQEKKLYILANFDFHTVTKTMKALNWTWATIEGIPTFGQLYQQADRLLSEVIEAPASRYYVGTGGFKASKEDGFLSLEFTVTDFDTDGIE